MADTPREIRIRLGEGVTQEQALRLVASVVAEGRVSKSPHGASYCLATTFSPVAGGEPELVVYADRTRTTDTFRVRQYPRAGNRLDITPSQ